MTTAAFIGTTASNWSQRLKMAELTLAAADVPFKYEVLPVKNSLAAEITECVDYKITGIDSFIDNLSDPNRWEFITKWPLIVLSIPGIEDSTLIEALQSASEPLSKQLRYT